MTSRRILFHGSSSSSSRILSFANERLILAGNRSVNLRVDSRNVGGSTVAEAQCGGGARWRINNDSVEGVIRHRLVADTFSLNPNQEDASERRSLCLGDCDSERQTGPVFRLPSSTSSSITSATASRLTTPTINSLLDEPLELSSASVVFLRGNEGVSIDAGASLRLESRPKSAEILVRVERTSPETRFVGGQLKLKAENIILGAGTIGRGRENASSRFSSSPHPSMIGFKLCVCATNGRLFRVTTGTDGSLASVGCFNLSEKNNPCLTA